MLCMKSSTPAHTATEHDAEGCGKDEGNSLSPNRCVETEENIQVAEGPYSFRSLEARLLAIESSLTEIDLIIQDLRRRR